MNLALFTYFSLLVRACLFSGIKEEAHSIVKEEILKLVSKKNRESKIRGFWVSLAHILVRKDSGAMAGDISDEAAKRASFFRRITRFLQREDNLH